MKLERDREMLWEDARTASHPPLAHMHTYGLTHSYTHTLSSSLSHSLSQGITPLLSGPAKVGTNNPLHEDKSS